MCFLKPALLKASAKTDPLTFAPEGCLFFMDKAKE
jgi:hypothetical protein